MARERSPEKSLGSRTSLVALSKRCVSISVAFTARRPSELRRLRTSGVAFLLRLAELAIPTAPRVVAFRYAGWRSRPLSQTLPHTESETRAHHFRLVRHTSEPQATEPLRCQTALPSPNPTNADRPLRLPRLHSRRSR